MVSVFTAVYLPPRKAAEALRFQIPGLTVPDEIIAFQNYLFSNTTGLAVCVRVKGTELGKSSIQGRGFKATKPIPALTVVAAKAGWVGDETDFRKHSNFSAGAHQQIGNNRFLLATSAAERKAFLIGYNHSDEPNCMIVVEPENDVAYVVTLRDIAAGEDLTTNYSVSHDSDTYKIKICTCHAQDCAKKVTPLLDWMQPAFQAKYAGQFPAYRQEQIDAYNALSEGNQFAIRSEKTRIYLAEELTELWDIYRQAGKMPIIGRINRAFIQYVLSRNDSEISQFARDYVTMSGDLFVSRGLSIRDPQSVRNNISVIAEDARNVAENFGFLSLAS